MASNRMSAWRSSYWGVALIAVCIGALTIVFSLAVDWMAHGLVRRLYASDLLDGLAAGVLSGFALFRMQARKRELLMRMQIVEDVNHHVRNALTSITLSAGLQADPELNSRVREASDRIDWVLNDVLSETVLPRKLQNLHPVWKPGRQLHNAHREPQEEPRPTPRSEREDHPPD